MQVAQSCPTLRPRGLDRPWASPGQDTGAGRHALLQGIFPNQGSNPGLLHCRRIVSQLNHQGSPSSGLRLPQSPAPGVVMRWAWDPEGEGPPSEDVLGCGLWVGRSAQNMDVCR